MEGGIAQDHHPLFKAPMSISDAGVDSTYNRQCIFNAGMISNIKENSRNRKTTKRGRKCFFNAAIAVRIEPRQWMPTPQLVCWKRKTSRSQASPSRPDMVRGSEALVSG
jgi:hypothetical protein